METSDFKPDKKCINWPRRVQIQVLKTDNTESVRDI